MQSRTSKKQQQRELVFKATQILRAADRKKRTTAERAPPPKARALPPASPDHLRLADLGWAMKQLRRRQRRGAPRG